MAAELAVAFVLVMAMAVAVSIVLVVDARRSASGTEAPMSPTEHAVLRDRDLFEFERAVLADADRLGRELDRTMSLWERALDRSAGSGPR